LKAINDIDPAGDAALRDIAAHEFAARADWSLTGERDHFVQFYEAESFLLESLGGFIGEGLEVGDSCVVVSARERREGLEERLRANGIDVDAAKSCGRYVALDAEETLAAFTVEGSLDAARFTEVIGSVLARAAAAGKRVRAYGDMVAALCAQGRHADAVLLEGMWNELGTSHAFSLFCAYPMTNFEGESFATSLGGVCAEHSCVIPAESYTALDTADKRLRAVIRLQQKANSLEAEIAERKRVEESLRALKDELETQVVERGRLLERERLARAEAESACRLKDEFLATVSHELRTPLNAIMGWSHMLRAGGLDEANAARAIETIARNAQAQAQLIEDILDVSRVITGKLHLDIAPVDVASVINTAIDSVQLAADAKGVRLKVVLDRSARLVAGDAARLRQVIWNLVSNAIKFTPASGRVTVRLERAGADARLTVSDTGCGISAEFLPFIFDRFRQADGTSTRRHGGLGLGLAIVRHLVELHGGTVAAASDGEGLGATFSVTLPLALSEERASRRRRQRATGADADSTARVKKSLPSLEGVRVLVVDDDRDTLQMLNLMLAGRGAEVCAASSVAEALEAFEQFEPDVVVSDLAMPDEDGYSLISKLRALDAGRGVQTPAVALTAYVRVEDRARSLSAGYNMFVAKPVELSELVTAIAHLTETDAA
jgi:signal transduction histidine kinase/CheY-like chemotaxis protein